MGTAIGVVLGVEVLSRVAPALVPDSARHIRLGEVGYIISRPRRFAANGNEASSFRKSAVKEVNHD